MFNETLKKRYLEYKNAINIFNANKTNENRAELIRLKKIYKKLEYKLKKQYKCHQGNMLNYLRKYNPKRFYKHFQKRRQTTRSELTTDDFLNHFRNLASSEPNVNHEVDEFLSNYHTHADSSYLNNLDADITERNI